MSASTTGLIGARLWMILAKYIGPLPLPCGHSPEKRDRHKAGQGRSDSGAVSHGFVAGSRSARQCLPPLLSQQFAPYHHRRLFKTEPGIKLQRGSVGLIRQQGHTLQPL